MRAALDAPAPVGGIRGLDFPPGQISVDAGPFEPDLGRLERLLRERRWPAAAAIAERVLVQETSLGLKWPEAMGFAREALGCALTGMGMITKAARQFELSLRHRPSARAAAGLARAIWQTADHERQRQLLDTAIALEPREPLYHVTRGEVLLTLGEWEAGFAGAEHRLAYRAFAHPAVPLWTGESLAGKTLFVAREGGQGDALMYGRYLPALRAQGATVKLHTWPSLLPLFRELATTGPDRAVADEFVLSPEAPADCWVPLMSLPFWAGTTPENVPPPLPLGRLRVARTSGRPRVGLVWAGGSATLSDPIRSAPAEAFRGLVMAHPDVRWTVLQAGEPAAAGRRLPWLADADWPELDPDWRRTRDLVHSCDLVITVDTAIAHLAGSMSVPTWLLCAKPNEWRWMLGRSDTPWYPSVRIFRQTVPRQWHTCLRQVERAFEAEWN